MTTAALPSFAKIRELRLAIQAPTPEVRRPANMKAPYPPTPSEVWQGEILFASMTRLDLHKLHAFFAALDGRVTPFAVSAIAGFSTLSHAFTGAIAVQPQRGLGSIYCSVSAGSGTIEPGTLLAVGDIDTTTYQVVETIKPAAISGGFVNIEVAPRLYDAYAVSTPVTAVDVKHKFILGSDDLESWRSLAGYGQVSAKVVEAIGV